MTDVRDATAPSRGFLKKLNMDAVSTLKDNSEYLDASPQKRQKTDQNKQIRSYARRLASSQFVGQLQTTPKGHMCCSIEYTTPQDLYRHINSIHTAEITSATNQILDEGSHNAKWKVLQRTNGHTEANIGKEIQNLPHTFTDSDEYAWLPHVTSESDSPDGQTGQILLFYKYCDIPDTHHVREWQEALCTRLKLTGKVRVACEGLNATVAGSTLSTETYMTAVMNHPYFSDMTREEFKTSEGTSEAFPNGLRVGIFDEAVPMGIKPNEVSYKDAGIHLTPKEFHQALIDMQVPEKQSEAVLIDCRNFYESKIGRFDGAVAPDIRKFSYWPEYVNENAHLFRNKDVFMYCTGGIRCERGSAYLKSQGLCREVYQLEGGIHKYAEQYPEGLFKGKLFVFDNRYAIPVNDTVLSACIYCGQPWDKYTPCSSDHCHQLVLACEHCQNKKLTACCATCQHNHELKKTQEECECTRRRDRVVREPTGTNTGNKGDNSVSGNNGGAGVS